DAATGFGVVPLELRPLPVQPARADPLGFLPALVRLRDAAGIFARPAVSSASTIGRGVRRVKRADPLIFRGSVYPLRAFRFFSVDVCLFYSPIFLARHRFTFAKSLFGSSTYFSFQAFSMDCFCFSVRCHESGASYFGYSKLALSMSHL